MFGMFRVGDLVYDTLTGKEVRITETQEGIDNLWCIVDSSWSQGYRTFWEIRLVINKDNIKKFIAEGRIQVEKRMTVTLSEYSTLALCDYEIDNYVLEELDNGKYKLYNDIDEKTRVVIKFSVKEKK